MNRDEIFSTGMMVAVVLSEDKIKRSVFRYWNGNKLELDANELLCDLRLINSKDIDLFLEHKRNLDPNSYRRDAAVLEFLRMEKAVLQ